MTPEVPSPIASLPFIRQGDNVFIINNRPPENLMKESLERMTLRLDNYRCPFSILDEFEQWWTWHYETRAKGQSTGWVICQMLSDVERIKAHKIERRIEIRARYDYGPILSYPSMVFKTCT